MHSHRRPRGKIFFEAFCAVTVGVSFVGAWVQTGAWAFLAPAFLFTLFGLYWTLDMFGREPAAAVAAVDAEPVATAPVARVAPEPQPAEPADIRFERFELPAEPVPEPVAYTAPKPAIEPAPVAAAKPKRRTKSAAKPAESVVERIEAPVPIVDEPVFEEAHQEPHIEPLFDPQPFARQARPAFGKRPRGPGPRPLPA